MDIKRFLIYGSRKILGNKFFIGGFLLVTCLHITILVPYVVKHTLPVDFNTNSMVRASHTEGKTISEFPTIRKRNTFYEKSKNLTPDQRSHTALLTEKSTSHRSYVTNQARNISLSATSKIEKSAKKFKKSSRITQSKRKIPSVIREHRSQQPETTRTNNSYDQHSAHVLKDLTSIRFVPKPNHPKVRPYSTRTQLNLWNMTKSLSIPLTTKSTKNVTGDEWKYDIKCINSYPSNIDMVDLSKRLLQGEQVRTPIINSHPFTYLHSPDNLCSRYKGQGQQRLRLVILVKSAVPYNQLRYVIRQTWGRGIRNMGMVYAFLLGFMSEYQRYLDSEANSFHDIIQENFVEAYRNNTYKTIMAYNWVVQYCPIAEKILLLDDDVYLNIKMLSLYLDTVDALGISTLSTGYVDSIGVPQRTPGKGFISEEEYKCSHFPPYLFGMAIIQSMDVVQKLQVIFPYVLYLHRDDLYIGLAAFKLGIKPIMNPYITIASFNQVSFLITLHGFRNSPRNYFNIYKQLEKFGMG